MAKNQIKESVVKQPHSFLHPLRRRVQTDVSGPSITQSEFAKECDINYLVEKHVKAGIPFPVGADDAFGDVSDVVDFQAAQDIVARARESWMSIDAKIRRRFGDKVENFLEAIHDKDRVDELVSLKIFKKPAEKAQEQASGGGVATTPKTPPVDEKKGASQGSGGPA